MKILKIINPANITEEEAKKLRPRLAARGIVFDKNNNVAVLLVSNHNYYKLPGGGVEEGEDNILAFRRECLEEIGFDVEVISELGIIIEYRTEFSEIQTSYCYLAKTSGEKRETSFTEHEIGEGFQEAKWVTFEEAYKLVSTSDPDNYEGVFIKERDITIFNTAEELL